MKKKLAYLLSVLLVTVMANSTFAYADTPTIVTGSKKLLGDALTWVLILVPVSAALTVGYHAWMKTLADGEPGAIAERNKKMKTVLIGAAIAECASGLVTLFLSYYSS